MNFYEETRHMTLWEAHWHMLKAVVMPVKTERRMAFESWLENMFAFPSFLLTIAEPVAMFASSIVRWITVLIAFVGVLLFKPFYLLAGYSTRAFVSNFEVDINESKALECSDIFDVTEGMSKDDRDAFNAVREYSEAVHDLFRESDKMTAEELKLEAVTLRARYRHFEKDGLRF